MNLYTEDIRELIKEESRIIEDFEKHNAPSEIIRKTNKQPPVIFFNLLVF